MLDLVAAVTFAIIFNLPTGCIKPMTVVVPMEHGKDAFLIADWAEGKISDADLLAQTEGRAKNVMIKCKGETA